MWSSQEHSVPRAPQVKFSPSLLVWGGITARDLTKLHIIPHKTSVDSNYYISEIIEKEVKPAFSHTKISTDLTATKLFSCSDGLFHQDGACAHKSRATMTWLDKNIGQYIPPENWPQIRQTCLQLKTFGILWPQPCMLIQSHKHWKHFCADFAKPGGQFLWQLFKILLVLPVCLTDWKQLLTIKGTLFVTDTTLTWHDAQLNILS